jgi:OmpA-OmpF porin, OOP family
MGTVRNLWVGAFAACAACSMPLQAQEAGTGFTAPHGFALPGTRSYLGLTVGRGRNETNCPDTTLLCESRDRSAQVYAGTMFDRNWGAEVAYVEMGRLLRPGGESRAQGLNLSLVGRAQVARAVGVFGKVGTTYGRTDTSVMGNTSATGPEQGFGLSWGGGVSYDFTPRLSATFEWDSRELHFAGGNRDPVRSTSLGLKYRY